MFLPVVTELHRDEVTATSAHGREGIMIEIGGVVVRAARGVDPAWLQEVLRAVKAAT
jgi:transposase